MKHFNYQKSIKEYGVSLAGVLAWFSVLMLAAWLAPQFWSYKPSFPYADSLLQPSGLPAWLYSWANFDGVHYLTIISKGYLQTGLIQAFFPVFPGLIKSISMLFGQPILVAIVSNLIITSIWVYLLIFHVFEKKHRQYAVMSALLILLYPTSFFFIATYSESLFALEIVALLALLKHKKWWWASAVIAVASATRVVGVGLVAILLGAYFNIEAPVWNFRQWWKTISTTMKPKLIKSVALALASSLGLLAYMIFLWINFGNPLYFAEVQSSFGVGRSESFIILPQVIFRYAKMMTTVPLQSFTYLSVVHELLSTVGIGLLLLYSSFLVPITTFLTAIAIFILPTLSGTLTSMPRYALPLLVLLLPSLVLKIPENKLHYLWIWIGCSTMLLLFFTTLFIQGYWVA